jgi:hypothetical protein
MRPRTDERHLGLEDVHERGSSSSEYRRKTRPIGGDPWIAAQLELRGIALVLHAQGVDLLIGVHDHAAELEQVERSSPFSRRGGAGTGRTRAGHPDGEDDRQKQRRAQDLEGRCGDPVQYPVDQPPVAAEFRFPDLNQRKARRPTDLERV